MTALLNIINGFNSTFSANASLCEDLKVDWDLGDCRSFALYQLVEDQRSAPFGTVLYQHIGSYNTGPHYEKEGTAGFRLNSQGNSIERFFPLSSNGVTNRLYVEYRSTRLGGSCAFSSIPFDRWWVDSFKTLCADVPVQAEQVNLFLTREIVSLAEIARRKGSKSGWVYHRFQDRLEYLSMRVNQEFLITTRYFLKPELFFNECFHKLVGLNEQEKIELINKYRIDIHFDNPFRK